MLWVFGEAERPVERPKIGEGEGDGVKRRRPHLVVGKPCADLQPSAIEQFECLQKLLTRVYDPEVRNAGVGIDARLGSPVA